MITITLSEIKGFSLIMIACITWMGGYLAYYTQARPKLLAQSASLSCGIFLSAALIHLAPHAYTHLSAEHSHPLPILLAWMGGIGGGLWLIDHLFAKHESSAYVLTTLISLHAISAGIVLGGSLNFTQLQVIALAILAHKSLESFALLSLLLQRHRQKALLLFGFFSMMTPLGGILGLQSFHLAKAYPAQWQALTAGTFLYLAFGHDDPKTRTRSVIRAHYGYAILGFILMGVLSWM